MTSTRIVMEAVPPEEMRLAAYREEGCGDWYIGVNGDVHIKVAGADVWDQLDMFLLALHELFEARACFRSGVVQGAVDAFDAAFEAERAQGLHGPDEEPGDDPRAPYRVQHRDACIIEHVAARLLGVTDHGVVR